MARIPNRTLVLMVLALAAFGWMWSQTHRRADPDRAVRATVVSQPEPPRPPLGGDR